MTTLNEHLHAQLGDQALTSEASLLSATDARAARLPRHHGVLYSDAVRDAIDQLADPAACAGDMARSAYYLGLQIGWRVAQRLR
jgi:hypothetical protein